MSLEFFLLYTLTVFIASIIPGPSMLLALTHGMQFGARRAVASALGNLSVSLLQAAVSIAGLGAVLVASEVLFNVIKWLGAAYLIYMGLSIWRAPRMAIAANEPEARRSPAAPLRKMFLQAALVTAANPKAIVFFTAVFPQFINPATPFTPQLGVLLGAGGVIAFGCFMLYAIGGQKIVSLFSHSAIGKYANKTIGGTFIGSGIGLAVSNK